MSFYGHTFLPDYWDRKDYDEAARHGVTVEEWRGFRQDQAAFEDEEHRGRLALAGDNLDNKKHKD
jgi:hypothetical protein